ncbi:MAG: hypothetical protein LBK53_02195 [Heliobacteriaceae bacterium]|jgi:hypothetical protein|nr:hypothetical protein [Heliobacteriaceae bacterium]
MVDIRPITRLTNGFSLLGAQKRPPDARTAEELRQTFQAYAQKIPEVKAFLPELENLNPKHYGIVADVIELSKAAPLLSLKINFFVKDKAGKTFLSFLLEQMGWASKNNPSAVDFAGEVINNTDILTSKYFLVKFSNAFKIKELGKHFEAAKPMVSDIAESALGGDYAMNFSKRDNFVGSLGVLTSKSAKLDKVSLLKTLSDKIDSIASNSEYAVSIDEFVTSEVPVSKIKDNLETLVQAAQLAESRGVIIDPVKFVLNNTNLR